MGKRNRKQVSEVVENTVENMTHEVVNAQVLSEFEVSDDDIPAFLKSQINNGDEELNEAIEIAAEILETPETESIDTGSSEEDFEENLLEDVEDAEDFEENLLEETIDVTETMNTEEYLANVENQLSADEILAQAGIHIDAHAETALTSDVIDHSTQVSSWSADEEAVSLEAATVDVLASDTAFDDAMSQVSDVEVAKYVVALVDALDNRADFERQKNPENTSIHKTLNKVRGIMVSKRCARVLLACGVQADFSNRVEKSGSRYNVYALGKIADLMVGLSGGVITNAINIACVKSLFNFEKNGLTMMMEDAKGAAGKNYAGQKLSADRRKYLISHTVSDSTVSTQASSTMQALETLGVVKQIGGKNASFEIQGNAVTGKLREIAPMLRFKRGNIEAEAA